MTVTVANVAPTASISGPATVDEGSVYTLTVGPITDPGTDTRSSYTIAWGDGLTDSFTAAEWATAAGSFTHTYADGSSSATITVSTTDEDGSYALDPTRKEWEFALLLIRAFRSLDSIVGDEAAATLVVDGDNVALVVDADGDVVDGDKVVAFVVDEVASTIASFDSDAALPTDDLAGDELLVKFGERLATAFGSRLLLARYGGDEFALLSNESIDRAGAIAIAERVEMLASTPFQLRGHQVFTGASIGIVMVERGDTPPEEILRDADTAMFRAKSQGGGYTLFDQQMHAAARERLALETDLRFALTRGELLPYFQPLISLETRRIVGIEALVRWQHPLRGLLAPVHFLGVAEETGMLPAIDLLVLEQSLAQWVRWQSEYGELAPQRLSVNISDRLFASTEFPANLAHLLERSGANPAQVHLEITETVLLDHSQNTENFIAELGAAGVRFALDDFGTGYSTFTYLKRLPLDQLKIDRSFVQQMLEDRQDQAIVEGVIALAHTFACEVVAEGVETPAQAARLVELGCPAGQGNGIAAAMPAEQMPGWVRSFAGVPTATA